MQKLEVAKARLGTIAELLHLLWQHKLWWLIPLVMTMLVLLGLIAFAQASGIAPFIYTLF